VRQLPLASGRFVRRADLPNIQLIRVVATDNEINDEGQSTRLIGGGSEPGRDHTSSSSLLRIVVKISSIVMFGQG
jgi:hypothetical protein